MFFPGVQKAYLNIDYNLSENTFSYTCSMGNDPTAISFSHSHTQANNQIQLISQHLSTVSTALLAQASSCNQINLKVQITKNNELIHDSIENIDKARIVDTIDVHRSNICNDFNRMNHHCQII